MLSTQTPVCPLRLLAMAQSLPMATTAVVNAGTPLAMESAMQAAQLGLIEPVLVGDSDAINACASELAWDISGLEIVAAETEEEAAAKAVALAKAGRVQMLMKGHVHSDTLLRAVLNKEHGLRTGARLSHVFHMTVPDSDRSLCVTDAVINVAPDLVTQMHIFNNCVGLMHALGVKKPNVALLSATEVASKAMPSSLQAKEFLDTLSEDSSGKANVFGPVAMDGAISPEAAKIKGIDAQGAGHADVLMVPNIETGNAIFKQMVYFNAATAAGLVLGAQVPVMLTSRADPIAARIASAALGAVYSHWQQQTS